MLVIQERTKFENFPWHPVNLSQAANGHGLVPWLQQICRFHLCWTQCFLLQSSSHPPDNQHIIFVCWPVHMKQCIFSQWIASSVQGTNRVVSIVSSSHCHHVATCVQCERGIILFFCNSEDSDVGGLISSGEGLLYYDREKPPMFVCFVYYWHSLANGMLYAGLVLMAYPLLDTPQRKWFVGDVKTLPTAAPTGTIILYGEMEGQRMKESSRETGRPFRSSERPLRFWGPPSLLYGWFYPRGYSCRVGNLTDHSRPSSAITNNDWSYTFIYPYVFTAWCWTKHKDSCLFYCSDIRLGGPRNTTRM